MALDSARQNLASSFVNSFVNAAFGTDKLLTEDGNKWIYKNKEHGKQKRHLIQCGWDGETFRSWVITSTKTKNAKCKKICA